MSPEKRGLGKGLGALLGSAAERSAPAEPPASDLQTIPISRIRPNPFQPRTEFDPADLAELQASLKESGLLQPITVRRKGDAYELIAGERRLRAATNLGWKEITAIVRDFDDRTMLVLALVENLQRANLNTIEEARGYRRLLDEFKLTQQQVADAVGKDRTTVTNLLRVLTLPEPIQRMVEQGQLTSGHARALLALTAKHDVHGLAKEAAQLGMSVRQLEQRVREMMTPATKAATAATSGGKGTTSPSPSVATDPAVRRLEDDLRRHLQTDVRIQLSGPDKGKIELTFYSNDDLDRLLEVILGDRRRDF